MSTEDELSGGNGHVNRQTRGFSTRLALAACRACSLAERRSRRRHPRGRAAGAARRRVVATALGPYRAACSAESWKTVGTDIPPRRHVRTPLQQAVLALLCDRDLGLRGGIRTGPGDHALSHLVETRGERLILGEEDLHSRLRDRGRAACRAPTGRAHGRRRPAVQVGAVRKPVREAGIEYLERASSIFNRHHHIEERIQSAFSGYAPRLRPSKRSRAVPRRQLQGMSGERIVPPPLASLRLADQLVGWQAGVQHLANGLHPRHR